MSIANATGLGGQLTRARLYVRILNDRDAAISFGGSTMSSGPFDLWHVMLGDCRELLSGSEHRGVADHVICDPPYEAQAHTKQRTNQRPGSEIPRHLKQHRVDRHGKHEIAPMRFAPLTPRSRTEFAELMCHVSAGWVLVFCQGEALGLWRTALVTAGARWMRGAVWDKCGTGTPQITGDRPAQGWEAIAIAWAGEGRSRWNAGGKDGIWRCRSTWMSERKGRAEAHPTQKPLQLMEALVRDFTQPGQLICDPFMGSGTTGVAALRLGRRFLGCELDEEWHAKALRRLGAVREQTEIFDRPAKPKQSKLDL